MAKKFVRGITDIKNIEHQDFDTNNVNDLLSDGQNNYIHRKKGNTEEYHNLTDNLKTIRSDDTDLLTVTNYNNTTNSATIRPKHDAQKEQLLESSDETIVISHGENGTDETTSVDVNPEKVLEHDNLLTSYGISKTTSGNNTTLGIEYTRVADGFDLNDLVNGQIRGSNLVNAPHPSAWFLVSAFSEDWHTVQKAVKLTDESNLCYVRRKRANVWGQWYEQVTNKSTIDALLAQKQNTLTSNTSIGVNGNGLQQLYTQKETYSHENGSLITYSKSVANSTSISTADEEFHFFVRLNKGTTTASFTLNEHDTAVFNYLMTEHGVNNQFNLNNSIFTLNGSTLEYFNNSTGVTYNNFITTFTYLIPSNPTPENVQSSNSREELTQDTPTIEVEKQETE